MSVEAEHWAPVHELGCWRVKRYHMLDGRKFGRYAMGRGTIRKFATEQSAKAFADKLNKVKQS